MDQAERLRELVRERGTKAGKYANSRVIVVASAKGGVGKTNLAANLAIGFAQLGKKALIIDGDLGLADVHVILGVLPAPKYNIFHLIFDDKSVDEVVATGPVGVKFIAGAASILRVTRISSSKIKNFIQKLVQLDVLMDIIIIDTSPGVSYNMRSFTLNADELILITTKEPTSIGDTLSLLRMLRSSRGYRGNDIRKVNIRLVVNRVQSITEGKQTAEYIREIASRFLDLQINILGYIFEDVALQRAVMQQHPVMLAYPHSKIAMCINHIRDQLNGEVISQPRGIYAFFKRLFAFQPKEDTF